MTFKGMELSEHRDLFNIYMDNWFDIKDGKNSHNKAEVVLRFGNYAKYNEYKFFLNINDLSKIIENLKAYKKELKEYFKKYNKETKYGDSND